MKINTDSIHRNQIELLQQSKQLLSKCSISELNIENRPTGNPGISYHHN